MCYEGETSCSSGGYECGPINDIVAVNPLAVCVLIYVPDEYPGPLRRLEGFLCGALCCMYAGMAAPQCRQRCLCSVCDHPQEDFLV